MSRRATVLVSLAILAAAAGVTAVIFLTEPTAQRETATKETAMLVEVVEVRRGTYQPLIAAMGTVEPAQEIMLSPRVRGEIVDRSPAFVPGGVVRKGEVLVTLDASDYEATLRQRRSELAQAEADFALEMGRQDVARQDLELVGETLPAQSRALILREPQLKSAQARLESARAAARQAELDLERTTIEAPFDARILTRTVNVGSQVDAGDVLGRLVGRERYWVATAVPLSKLRWIEFDEGGDTPARARVRNRAAWPEGVYREGFVFKLVGTLEAATRMARVLVEVPDPLGSGDVGAEEPTLMIGAFVEVLIDAREIKDVVRVNRDYVRQNGRIWVMKDGVLRIREADIAFRDDRYAYVRSGLEDGDRVVVTNLATPTEGAALRVEGEGVSGEERQTEEGE